MDAGKRHGHDEDGPVVIKKAPAFQVIALGTPVIAFLYLIIVFGNQRLCLGFIFPKNILVHPVGQEPSVPVGGHHVVIHAVHDGNGDIILLAHQPEHAAGLGLLPVLGVKALKVVYDVLAVLSLLNDKLIQLIIYFFQQFQLFIGIKAFQEKAVHRPQGKEHRCHKADKNHGESHPD